MTNFEIFLYPFLISVIVIWSIPANLYKKTSIAKYIHLLTPLASMYLLFGTKEETLPELKFTFAFVFILITFLSSLNSLHIKNKWHDCSSLFYAGSAIGVVTSSNWLNFLLSWEMMLLGSVFLILSKNDPESRSAAIKYFYYHLFSGSLVMFGIANLPNREFDGILLPGWDEPYSLLILVGVLLNAAVPPLHSWVPDIYPKSSPTANVFLSAFTTKAAVYVLIKFFVGLDFLIYIGAIMAIYGVVFAMISNSMRKLLSYHIVSQVGYMVVGVGVGTSFSADGSAAHAFSHIIYKGLLFMSVSSLIYATGKEKITELGGLIKKTPFIFVGFAIGALSIAGAPGFNGFISKSMIVDSVHIAHLETISSMLSIASIGTFLSIGMKMGWFIFFGKNTTIKLKKIPKNMSLAMGISSIICFIFGIKPNLLYGMLPGKAFVDSAVYNPWSKSHVLHALEILGVGFFVFLIFKKYIQPKEKTVKEFGHLYSKIFGLILNTSISFSKNVSKSLELEIKNICQNLKKDIRSEKSTLIGENPLKTLPLGERLLTVLFLMLVFLLLAG